MIYGEKFLNEGKIKDAIPDELLETRFLKYPSADMKEKLKRVRRALEIYEKNNPDCIPMSNFDPKYYNAKDLENQVDKSEVAKGLKDKDRVCIYYYKGKAVLSCAYNSSYNAAGFRQECSILVLDQKIISKHQKYYTVYAAANEKMLSENNIQWAYIILYTKNNGSTVDRELNDKE